MTMPGTVATLTVAGCRCVRISPDGTSVLTVGDEGIQVREASGGPVGWSRAWQVPAEFPVESVWGAGGDSVTVLTGGALRLLDAVTGADRPVPDELAGRSDVTALGLSHSGLTLAVGTREGIVLLWQQDTGRVTRLRGGGDPVSSLAWRPSGDELCVARPRSLQFWLLPAETMISSVDMGDVNPLRLAWAPDGDLIVVLGLRDVRVLSVMTRGESAPPLLTGGRPAGLGFSRTGAMLLVALPGGSVACFDRQLQPAEVLRSGRSAAVTEPAMLHVNETGLVAVRSDATTVTVFGLSDTALPDEGRRRAVALRRWAAGVARVTAPIERDAPSPVPSTLARRAGFAWTDDGWLLQERASGELSRFGADGQRRWVTPAGTGPLSGDTRFVAIGGADGRTTVLDAATGGPITVLAGTGPASWAPHALAVAAPRRRDILVYDLSWNVRTVPVPDGVGDPAWSPDGTTLAAASTNAIVVWDGRTLARTRRLEIGATSHPPAVLWSPDGARLAVGRTGGPVTVWNTGTWQAGRPMGRSAGDGRQALAWSPDSRLLAVPTMRPIGAVELWDARHGRLVLTVPPPPEGARPVSKIDWSADGRFAVVHDDGTVVRWAISVPPPQEDERPLPHPAPILATLVAATALRGTTVPLGLLGDLFALVLGRDAGPLAEFDGHPGIVLLRSLRWPPEAAVGLAVLVAAGLPAAPDLAPPADPTLEELRGAVEHALAGVALPAGSYQVPAAEILAELDTIDDSVLVLATLLGPAAVAAAPDLIARVRSQSFGGWSLAPPQRRLLGLRATVSTVGGSQGHGVGDTRGGIARHGELPSLLPSQLALPRAVLTAKKGRDELLFRTRQGDLPVEAQPVVLLLDDTPAAFGAVGVTLRVVANLLAGVAVRQHRRCALVQLSSSRVTFLTEMADLVHLWAGGAVERPDLPAALAAANGVAAQLSDPVNGLPRLLLLTHPYLPCASRPGLHVVRVHYPGIPVEDPSPRTHVIAPGADADTLHALIGDILASS
ncbi:WD40 repeat domain-containing protein [Dactylosporangium aurantiacum]|uniref:WD40 repeat domain-containing protein n=1 Tax=Dactylosporangium aurantiacum TaxID=35754 RepID=A0A9Q9ME11_9ACTN|nr:WD40 repeat domain-containing protein [Dactylosporangium aurantiacum]MDG6101427.1 WD40 repeat domain-containing protein [Dactylosporangium aurantiacum]UWZ52719.1 WD40 repeat domain-containing protein [Dactylosporangium aurantiacum]